MRTLDHIKSGPGRLCIPCVYNSGRKACVRVNLNEPNLIHVSIEGESGRPYQMVLDHYLHIDSNQLESSACYQSVDDCKEVIHLINKHFFAGSLVVFSDDKAVVDKWIDKKRSMKEWIYDVSNAFVDDGDQIILEFLGQKLSILDRISNSFNAAEKQKIRIEVMEPLKEAHLGGSWQNYSEPGWINDAEKMSQSKVYLA